MFIRKGPHRCSCPGKANYGDVWECETCGKQWIYSFWMFWRRKIIRIMREEGNNGVG